MKKMKILHFAIANTKGGITQFVLRLWSRIDKSKFIFDFITFGSHLDFEDELKSQGCNVFHISCYPEENKEKFCKEFLEVLSDGYDLIEIHTNAWKSTIVEELAKSVHIKRIIIHSHCTGIPASILRGDDEKEVLQRHIMIRENLDNGIATDYVACSVAAAEWLFPGEICKKTIIFKNAIDTSRFKFNKNDRKCIRDIFGINDCFVYGYSGRFEDEKNIPFIIDVFTEMVKRHSDTRLLLVGDGKKKEKIISYAEKKGVINNILFAGYRDDVEKYYSSMDAFLMASFHEGFCISLLEAQCNGLGCIASDGIPQEVFVANNIKRLPLDLNKWIYECDKLYYSNGIERETYAKYIKQEGLDIQEQIKDIEKFYISNSRNE